ncbi:hypothetical protein H257_12080 [Aphanomyces astaci]|uniref:Tc1-like transposase DDE domain-containing protein n=1 Tax=Aphanomyces astaci TaxID=112090 RepID=W4G294_APHAT|nr:hypothetical protein H257_12080 [Aphanomyces astaci]ETV73043.1 hypothetical protein H257_12080 [Aphanomyces astaci]|eukprot:XP_009837492.1 hypothetical protein H257_12080 [Aphanomyces astaci]
MGVADEVAQLFDCIPSTVRRIWRRGSVNLSGSKTICSSISQLKKSTCGRKRLHKDLPKRIQAIPQSRRYCASPGSLAWGCQNRTCTTTSNKASLQSTRWALDHVCDRDGAKFFDDIYDTVHVDEKWLEKKVHGAIGEKIKQRSCKSKRHLLKVMLLTDVARPRWDETCGEWFDGKLGTWHFSEIVPAQRRSGRRDARTPVMKTVSVTRETYKAILVDKVCNPRQVATRDVDVVAAYNADGWDMEVVFQPPNSPDLNVLDLGFFRAIQALQAEKHSSSLEEIVAATDAAWDVVSTKTLNKNFLTLQRCLQEAILNKGGND